MCLGSYAESTSDIPGFHVLEEQVNGVPQGLHRGINDPESDLLPRFTASKRRIARSQFVVQSDFLTRLPSTIPSHQTGQLQSV